MTVTDKIKSIKDKGFALPTILIVSVVMMSVLLFSVSSTSSISTALKSQYYNQTAQYASDSGLAFASSCLNSSDNLISWSDSSPLRVNTDCRGVDQDGISCPDNTIDARCAVTVSSDSKIVSSFSVGAPKTKINGWRQITGSNNHTCGLGYDYKVYCWGYNGNGQLGSGTIIDSAVPVQIKDNGVMTGKNVKAISVGGSHTCAITFDSQVYCWGANASGQLGNTSNTDSSIPVQVTSTGVLLGKSILSISAGLSHTCAIASDGLVYCWGSGNYGQLGNNASSSSNIPVAVNMANGTSALYGKTIRQIASGGYHTCVIASDSLVYCWGYNVAGQLGDNSTTNRLAPVAINMSNGTSAMYGKVARSITANAISEVTNIGYGHTCVIASDNQAYCWGYNAKGQIGNNSTTNRLVATGVVTTGVLSGKTLRSISTAAQSSCVVASDGLVYCWGYNHVSQLGNGGFTDSLVPVASTKSGSPGGTNAISVSSGSYNACLIASDSQAYCWGLNTNGQLGDGSTINKTSATIIATSDVTGAPASRITVTGTTKLINNSGSVWRRYTNTKSVDLVQKNWAQFAAGGSHNCAIDVDGQAYCWGLNTNGQLGDNSTTQRNIPTAVNTANGVSALFGKTVKLIAAGVSHTCAVASDNLIYCWGLNTNGQLGDNSTTQRNAAVAVNMTNGVSALYGKTIIAISAGGSHTCALASDSLVYCWGFNSSGQLGDNSTTQRLIPVAVNTAASSLLNKTVISISAGASHTCAVAMDSTAHCWGLNTNGQIGDNSITQRQLPVAVNSVSGVSAMFGKLSVDISAAAAHTCLIATDGGLYCWGLNTDGQLGNRTTAQSQVPLAVFRGGLMNSASVTGVFTKDNGSCALSTANVSYCWGRGTGGQIGNNAILSSNEPLLTTMPGRSSIGL